MDILAKHFALKKDSIREPVECLGASVSECAFKDGDTAWAMGSEKCVKEVLQNVKVWLEKRDPCLKKKVPSVSPAGCRPELDLSSLCNEEDHSFCQEQIGVLHWAVELGRINICCEVLMLASHCVAPRVGHLTSLLHTFAHLNSHQRSRIAFDSTHLPRDEPKTPNWTDFCPSAVEELPPDMPEARGQPVVVTAFEDSDQCPSIG